MNRPKDRDKMTPLEISILSLQHHLRHAYASLQDMELFLKEDALSNMMSDIEAMLEGVAVLKERLGGLDEQMEDNTSGG